MGEIGIKAFREALKHMNVEEDYEKGVRDGYAVARH